MRRDDAGYLYRLGAALAIGVFTVALVARVGGVKRPDAASPAEPVSLGDTEERTGTDGGGQAETPTEPLDLTQTPPDVAAMRQAFAETHDADGAQDTVKETFFVTDHATDILGDVAIRNATDTRQPDFAALLEEGAGLTVEDRSAPVVLIYHTHTSESYALNGDGLYYPDVPTHRNESDRNMLRIGDELCAVLEQRGVGVIHDRNAYDDEYDGAYARSRKTALAYLEEYPTLQIAIDVHRDALKENGRHIKPTAVIDGKKAAQIMILTGAEEGDITFPHWESNLAFALQLQKAAQAKYMGLMKPLYFCPRRYNMDLTEHSVLLEIGTEVNTLEEAIFSARLIGDVLADCVSAASD
ncbi:MAG: stage II sporulation protein P [Clostridia bacterium]|nr:stage II sporulation protein P [Clostridia bacterium]